MELQKDGTIKGLLKNDIFKENIKGFYEILQEILGEHRNGNFDYFEKGMYKEEDKLPDINVEDDDGYSYEWADELRILNKDGVEIRIECEFIMLFLEGKFWSRSSTQIQS
ncbi:hypothetical protein [Neobacillus cucumis]|uniref:hypothetical protein n=1 Tax=Neobacillus cucumis TaxID=1740721 RepID=UPI001964EEB5|nr:hypothetical protein [Neobacillus cucumis]MBM7656207.1 hypothetical protein [Neobacillus cucumis]